MKPQYMTPYICAIEMIAENRIMAVSQVELGNVTETSGADWEDLL